MILVWCSSAIEILVDLGRFMVVVSIIDVVVWFKEVRKKGPKCLSGQEMIVIWSLNIWKLQKASRKASNLSSLGELKAVSRGSNYGAPRNQNITTKRSN